jgi:hypothetical protein
MSGESRPPLGGRFSSLIAHRSSLTILAVAALLVAMRLALPAGAFWISDAGNKFLVAENFAASGFRHVSIGYPAADLDPSFRWFPAAAGHFRPIGGRYFSIVPWLFPLLAALTSTTTSTTWLPLIAGIGIAMLVPPLLRAMGSDVNPSLAIAATIFATPLAFYSLDFWEHTLATLLATLAVVLLLRRSPLLAGLAAGASVAIREEGYVFVVAVLVGAFAWRFLAGALAALIPFWIAQQLIFGNPFGLHLASHVGGKDVALPARIVRNVLYFLFHFHQRWWVAALLALPALAAIVVGSIRASERVRTIAAAGCGVASAIGLLLMFANDDPIVDTIFTQGLFLSLPLAALFLVRWRELVQHDVVARIVAVYIVLMPLVLRANWSGIVWGPRYFLTIVPLLVALSLRRGRLALALVAVSIAIQLFGLVLLHRKVTAGAELVALLRKAPQVIVTDVYWLSEEASAIYFDKKMMQPPDDRELLLALASLRAHGVRDFAFVTSPRYRWFSPRARALVESLAVRRTRFAPRGVPLLSVDIVECKLPAP